jgi:hypothetical protein
MVILTLAMLLVIRLINNGFDFNSLSFEVWDFVILVILGISVATGFNRIKLEIAEIKDRSGLIKWMDDYFEKNKGNKIHESENHLVYEAEKPKRLISFSKTADYYLATFREGNATVEGPFSKKAKMYE